MKNTPADRSKAVSSDQLLEQRFSAILCAARRLWESGEYITRGNLIAATGMTEPICDSTLRAMVDQGLINRSIKGVYQLPEYATDVNQLYDVLYNQADVDGLFTDFPDKAVNFLKDKR